MKKYFAAAIVTLSVVAAVFAQADRDLVGTWKFDASRSKLAGPRDASAVLLIKYEHAGEVLRETMNVTGPNGSATRIIDYALDGRELTNGTGDDRVTSKIIKKDGALVLQWSDDGGVYSRTMSLSADGRTLTISTHDSNRDSGADDVIVFQRQ